MKIVPLNRLLICLMCSFAVSSPATAQLAVDRLWLDLEASASPRSDVLLRNESEDRYYIAIQAFEIINPGTDQEERRSIANPEELGLLITPNRLVMEPDAMRSIRVVSLNQPAVDRVYRLLIAPQVGAIEMDPGEGHSVAIKLLAAYDVLISVRPRDANADIVAERVGNELILRNQGNSNAVLYEGTACSAHRADDCEPVGSRRLYAGNEWRIPLRNVDDQVQFQIQRFARLDPTRITF